MFYRYIFLGQGLQLYVFIIWYTFLFQYYNITCFHVLLSYILFALNISVIVTTFIAIKFNELVLCKSLDKPQKHNDYDNPTWPMTLTYDWRVNSPNQIDASTPPHRRHSVSRRISATCPQNRRVVDRCGAKCVSFVSNHQGDFRLRSFRLSPVV